MTEALVVGHPMIWNYHFPNRHPFHATSSSSVLTRAKSNRIFLAAARYGDDYAHGGGGSSSNDKNNDGKKSNNTMAASFIAESSLHSDPITASSSLRTADTDSDENKNVESSLLSEETAKIFESLRTRKRQLQIIQTINNLRQSKCTIHNRIYLKDYVRRVAMLQNPPHLPLSSSSPSPKLAVCGGSRGGLYLLDLHHHKPSSSSSDSKYEYNNVLDSIQDAHNAQGEGTMSSYMNKILYGNFDGGGVVSLAMGQFVFQNKDEGESTSNNKQQQETWVASSGREGGASVWRIITKAHDKDINHPPTIKFSERIRLDGLSIFSSSNNSRNKTEMKDINDEEVLVTCLSFDDTNKLWVGCADGKIRVYQFSPSLSVPTLIKTFPVMPSSSSSPPPILDLFLSNELGCGACVTAASSPQSQSSPFNGTSRYCGTVHLFSLLVDDQNNKNDSMPFDTMKVKMIQPFRNAVHARSVCIVRNDVDGEGDEDEGQRRRTDSAFKKQSGSESSSADSNVYAGKWSLICGGSDGSLYRICLNVTPEQTQMSKRKFSILWPNPFFDVDLDILQNTEKQQLQNNHTSIQKATAMTAISPFTKHKMKLSHTGPVMRLMPHPSGGVFVSGGQDGTLRVWRCSAINNKDINSKKDTNNHDDTEETKKGNQFVWKEHPPPKTTPSSSLSSYTQKSLLPLPTCCYALFGYKFWLGSICTDGFYLVSDGTDDCVIVRDYS